MAQNLTAEQRLERISVQILRDKNYAFLSGILMLGDVYVNETGGPEIKGPGGVVATGKGTAGTNGKDEWYARDFVQKLNDKQLKFLRIHECYHKAYRHLRIWRHLWQENPELANIAADVVINNTLVKDQNLEMPTLPDPKTGKPVPCGMWDHKFDDMDTGQVFRALKQMAQQGGQGKKGKGGKPGDEEGKGSGSGSLKYKPGEFSPGDGEGMDSMDQHDWQGQQSMTPEQQKELERQIDQALRQGAILAGKMAGNMDRGIQEVLKPKLDWKELLREFVKSVCKNKDASSWRQINRRYVSQGIYMPGFIGESVGRIMIGIDTSGSIGGELLGQFLGEMEAICKEVSPEGVDLLYWDAAVAGHEKYEQFEAADVISRTKPKGGGGTAPSCVTEYMKKHKMEPVCSIILTDGYVGNDWGTDWPSPVLWAILGDRSAVATTGKTVYIEE